LTFSAVVNRFRRCEAILQRDDVAEFSSQPLRTRSLYVAPGSQTHEIRRMRSIAFVALTLSITLLLMPPFTQASETTGLNQGDAGWLRRDSFGLDMATVAQYRTLGRKALLEKQLDDRLGDTLPTPIAAQIASYESFYTPVDQMLTSIQQEQQQIKAMPDGPDKVAANKALQTRGNQLGLEAQQAELLAREVYGPNQLKEQLVWFWLNHFSVYAAKGRVRWELGDYEQDAPSARMRTG
jgi:hypothetical protein